MEGPPGSLGGSARYPGEEIAERTTPRGGMADGGALNKAKTSWAEGGGPGLRHQTQAGHVQDAPGTTWGTTPVRARRKGRQENRKEKEKKEFERSR